MVADHPPLSEGFFERVLNREDGGDNTERPILQVIGHRTLNNGERFRLLVSDGRHNNPWVMLATQLNDLVKNNTVNRHCIIRVNKHICNSMSKPGSDPGKLRKILILLELEVLRDGEGLDVIGDPINMNADGTFATPTVIATPSAPPSASSPDVLIRYSANGPALKRPPSPPHASEQPQPKMVPQRTGSGGGAPRSNYGSGEIPKDAAVPITMLTPYSQHWVIRGRITQKADIRRYSNSKGEGKLFSMTMGDESGEIRITFFNEAVDRCFDMLKVGNVYYLSGGKLKAANKQYSSVKNEYEITAGFETKIEPCEEDTPNIPKTNFTFVKIIDVARVDPNATIDVIGVVKSASEASTFTAKASQKEFTKRDLVLVDDSNAEINLTLWGETATKFDPTDQPVVAFKGVKVSDFGGRSLSALQSSVIMINPSELTEAQFLRGWFDEGGREAPAQLLTTRGGGGGGGSSEISSISLSKMPVQADETKWTSVLGTVVAFRESNCVYKSCGINDCKKKVTDQNDGTYLCAKCNLPNITTFTYRYMLSVFIRDATDGMWISLFDEQAKEVLGVDAQEVGTMMSTPEESQSKEVFQHALFKSYNFKLRSKMEMYNDDLRLRSQCNGISVLTAADEITLMEREMNRLLPKLGLTMHDL